MSRANLHCVILGWGCSILFLLAPPCHAQDAPAFFDLYADWRIQQSADYNLDGLVNYWDVLCLSYLWSGQSCHRFYMAGGGTGGAFHVLLYSTTREVQPQGSVMGRPPVAILRPSVDESGGLAQNTALAMPPVEIVRAALNETGGLPQSTHLALPPVAITRPAMGEPGGLPQNVALAMPPVEIVRAALNETGVLPQSIHLALPPVAITRPAIGEPGGLPQNTCLATPPMALVRPAFDETGGLASWFMLALPPVEIGWATAGKVFFDPSFVLDPKSLGLSRDQ